MNNFLEKLKAEKTKRIGKVVLKDEDSKPKKTRKKKSDGN